MALDDVAAHRVTGAERRLEVDAGAAVERRRASSARASPARRGTTSRSPSTDSAVRQTPLTETEPPTSTSGAVRGASISSRTPPAPPSRATTEPTSRTIPVNTPRGYSGAFRARGGSASTRTSSPTAALRQVEQRERLRQARRGSAARSPRASARRRGAACRRGRPRGTPSRASGRPRGGATALPPRASACELVRRAGRCAARAPSPSGSGPRPNASRRGCRRRVDLARVEPRSVGVHRPHPDGDGVGGGAELVDEPPRLLARHPARAGHGDAAVERDRGLVGDERAAERDPRAPGLVLLPRLEAVVELDLDARRAQPLEPAGGLGVRVERARDDAGDPAARIASTHGGVVPWCAHGSIVT